MSRKEENEIMILSLFTLIKNTIEEQCKGGKKEYKQRQDKQLTVKVFIDLFNGLFRVQPKRSTIEMIVPKREFGGYFFLSLNIIQNIIKLEEKNTHIIASTRRRENA